MSETKVAVGSLVAVPNSIRSGYRLGLVVNQDAGEQWIKRDPFPPTRPEGVSDLLIVRLLGEHTSELCYPHNNQLWGGEPRRAMTVRWAYVQTNPNPPWVIAGPDTFSIEKFFGVCKTCELLGMSGATFIGELQILLSHLKQNKLVVDETGIFERRYRTMLAEVLPISS